MYSLLKRFPQISLISFLLSFSFHSFAVQDQFGLDIIQGSVLRGGQTESSFSIGMQLENDSSFATSSSSQDEISISAHIYPDANDIGKTADVLVAAVNPNGLFMKTDQGAFIPWNGKPKDLVNAFNEIELTSDVALTLFNGTHNTEGRYRYFIAYINTDENELIFNLTPAKFTVENPQSSLMWRVSNGINEFIVGGTVHALRPGDLPFSEDYTNAYNETDILVAEINPDDLNDLSGVALLFRGGTGQLLSDTISESLYDRISTYFANALIDISAYELIHKNWIATDIQSIHRASLEYVEGVEAYFFDLAETDNRDIIGLEPFSSQIIAIKNLGSDSDESTEDFLSSVLDDVENGTTTDSLDELIDAWVNADILYFENLVAEGKEESQADNDILLTNRNLAWLPKLEAFLLTPEVEFVLVGTLHTVGEDSILTMLEENGYSIEPY